MATLKRRQFFRAVWEHTRQQLPPDLDEPRTRQTMNFLKVQPSPNYRIHYEAMISAQTGYLEVGLHFEDGPESTGRLLAFFDAEILAIKYELGEQSELERWTKSWGHLFEVMPLEPLTREYAERVAGRLSAYIITLQPLLNEAFDRGLVSHEPRPSRGGGRFSRARR
ncbi:MAG: hypothetical protein ACOC9Y_04185 [Chloroflexota bacterium]